MLYFKTSDLAYTYHVSVKTVQNWIDAAKQGKLDLDLYSKGKYKYVSNTERNIAILERLAKEGKKYRPRTSVKVVKPGSEFYKLFTEAQIYDIVNNLEVHHEVPRQYNYFDGGARHWDEYAHRLAGEDTPNMVNMTLELLEMVQSYLDALLGKYKRVNVVDIGVGNALPVRPLLAHLLDQKVLGRYIALDISREMLNIAERNIKEWFHGEVDFEDYELDITRDHFDNIIANEYITDEANTTVNLVLNLGGTLYNLRDPDDGFRIIRKSMGVRDLLIHSQKLDTNGTRRYFDFNVEPASEPTLPLIHRFIVDQLGIDKSLYTLKQGFDETTHQRYERIRFETPVTIEFEFMSGKRGVSFEKGDSILVWRSWQQTAHEVAKQFDQNGFYVLNSAQTSDRAYILTISQVNNAAD